MSAFKETFNGIAQKLVQSLNSIAQKLGQSLNGIAQKLGQSLDLSGAGKLAGIGAGSKPLVLALPIGIAVLGVALFVRKMRKKKSAGSIGRNVQEVKPAKTTLILLILFSALLLGLTGLAVYDHLKERSISVAAGTRKTESYVLAQALKTVTERHYPRLKITILEIEGAAEPLERGSVQLAVAQSDAPAGPSARSVAVLSKQRVLLARSDVDERVVYALTQVLMQRGQELADAIPVENAALRPLTASIQKPGVESKSDVPLHRGAVAVYDWDQTPFLRRYPRISVLAGAGVGLLGLWTWYLVHRAWRRRKVEQAYQERRLAIPAAHEPWTFSKILLARAGETAAATR